MSFAGLIPKQARGPCTRTRGCLYAGGHPGACEVPARPKRRHLRLVRRNVDGDPAAPDRTDEQQP